MSNAVYDYLKLLALIILPLGTLVSSIMGEWGVPHAEQVFNTFKYLDVFVGALVVVANEYYKKEHNGK